MSRGATGLAAAWGLSCAPLVLPAISADLALSLGDASRLALAALPWIAWLGLPRGAGGPGGSSLAAAALAAPPIAAGLGLDLSRGGDPRHLATLAGAALLVILALAFASDLAARTRPCAGAYAAAWFALVPGAPLLAVCLGLGGAPTYGDPPRWLAALARASPLGWIASSARPAAAGEPALAGALAALGASLVLLAVAGAAGGARSGGQAS